MGKCTTCLLDNAVISCIIFSTLENFKFKDKADFFLHYFWNRFLNMTFQGCLETQTWNLQFIKLYTHSSCVKSNLHHLLFYTNYTTTCCVLSIRITANYVVFCELRNHSFLHSYLQILWYRAWLKFPETPLSITLSNRILENIYLQNFGYLPIVSLFVFIFDNHWPFFP